MSKRAIQIRKDGIRLSWTDEEIDFVFDCLAAGMTAALTVLAMTEKEMRSDCLPITRNAVVGLWNRDKERKEKCQKQADLNRVPSRRKKPKDQPKTGKLTNMLFGLKTTYNPLPPRKPKIYIPPDDGVTMMELTNMMCRFPYGEGFENIRYCGHLVDFGRTKSYCKNHYQICYHTKK